MHSGVPAVGKGQLTLNAHQSSTTSLPRIKYGVQQRKQPLQSKNNRIMLEFVIGDDSEGNPEKIHIVYCQI